MARHTDPRFESSAFAAPVRRAYLPAETEPVTFGVHSEIAEHYGVDPEKFGQHAATLDYVVAAAGG